MGNVCGSMTSCASNVPTCGKFFSISFCLALPALSASVRSDVFLGIVCFLWKVRKLTPDTQTARDRWSDALRTPLCWMFCHSVEDRSSGCGSGNVGRGWPSTIRRGSVCFGVCVPTSPIGVLGVESLTAMLVRLRFRVDFAPFAGFSLGVSGAGGAASSRARALVDRRGSVMFGTLMEYHGMHVSIEKLRMTRSHVTGSAPLHAPALVSQHQAFWRKAPQQHHPCPSLGSAPWFQVLCSEASDTCERCISNDLHATAN